jgi:tetratricopeptide (TPR) repeat protein
MNSLAANLESQGRLVEAEELYRSVLEARRRVFGQDHPDVARTLKGLASTLAEMERWSEAEPLCREAESILGSQLPLDHRDRKTTTNLLGAILCGLGRFSEAEPLLLGSYESLQIDPRVRLDEKDGMVERLVRLYESWDTAEPNRGHAQKAAEWGAKLVKTQGAIVRE